MKWREIDNSYLYDRIRIVQEEGRLADSRQAAFLAIIGQLNQKKAYYSHLFNCGDLGFCLVEWRTRWTARWFDEAISFGAETSGILEDEVADCLSFTGERRKEKAR